MDAQPRAGGEGSARAVRHPPARCGGRESQGDRVMPTLRELASTIRSKNAGVDKITFDVIFRARENFERVRDSGVLSPDSVAKLFSIDAGRITDFVVFE